jgi:BCL2-associated athanogene 2
MDVGKCRSVPVVDSETHLPQIVESCPGSPQKSPKERLVDLLDQVGMHVERLRRDALKLEEEKDTLLTTLDTLRNSEMMIELSDSKYSSLCQAVELLRYLFLLGQLRNMLTCI